MRKNFFWIGIFVVFLVGLLTGIYLIKRNIWTGIYYPNLDKIEDQRTWVLSPPLYSLDKCREWVNIVHKAEDNYDYSCGQGCRFTTELYGETMICRIDTR